MEWLVKHGGAGIFAKPGAGKTAIALRAVLALKDAGILRAALVVTPLRPARTVWPVEPGEWRGTEWDRLNELKIVVLHGKHKERLAEEPADVYVINFDGLKWLFEDGAFKRFKRMGIDTFIVDESSKFKNHKTRRFKMTKDVLPTFARRWPMTGSPTPNGYINLFGQIYLIDMGRALGRYITHYRMLYFNPLDQMGWQWALKPGADKLIEKAIAPYIFHLEPGDYKEIPTPENVVRVDLPDNAARVYRELEEDMITRLEEGVVTAASAGVAAMKCAQVANGGLYAMPTEPGEDPLLKRKRTWENLHEAKIDAVEELVDELNGSPALVVYDFEHDLDRLRKRFPKAPWIGGGVSATVSERIIDEWNADQHEVLLVQGSSISHGLNMQHGHAQDIIWHSLTYDLEVFQQLNARLARQGSRYDQIFVHLIVARGTVDEVKLRALRRKDKTQRAFLESLKEYARTRRK